MTVLLSPVYNGFQGFLPSGLPNAGGLINTYLAGTSTPAATYTTSAGTIQNANPITLDSSGKPPASIWLTSGQAYKFVYTDSQGNNPVTIDNVQGSLTPPAAGTQALSVTSIAAARLLTSAITTIWVTSYYGTVNGTASLYVLDSSDTTSADNGATVIINASGGRLKLTNIYQSLSLRQAGAKMDGSADDYSAIQTWLNIGATGVPLTAESGTANFSQPLSLANPSNLVIRGAGMFATVFQYTGASTTVDLLSLGTNAGSQTSNMDLRGFRIASTTLMTAGSAFHTQNTGRCWYHDIVVDGQDGNGNLWNGMWFDQCDMTVLDCFQACGQNDSFRLNGGAGARPKADFFMDHGKITPANGKASAVGMRIGGAFGGLQVGAVDCIGNGINFVEDNTLAAEVNRELSFSAEAAFDSSKTGPCMQFSGGNAGAVYLSFSGSWVASGKTHGIQIDASSTSYHLQYDGGTIYNHTNDGLRNNNANADINIVGTKIWNSGGWGVNNTSGYRLQLWAPDFDANTSGNFTGGLVCSTTGLFFSGIANGANVAIPNGSGMVIATQQNNGNSTGTYVLGGGGAAKIASSNTAWDVSTTTPAATKASIAYDGISAYRIYNNTGASLNVGLISINSGAGN